ncbi:AtzE family amidohydrolase [Opitutales bacterium ASA1]|nr:AtzE family amidohydrolase [Opitutales bacterium ASA1]
MRFEDWQGMSPAAAARELARRIHSLDTKQRRAFFASSASEAESLARFEEAARSGGRLAGVPYGLKDLFAVKGEAIGAGSNFLREERATPDRDGTLVEVLRKVGAVCAGRAHLHEFAYGLTGENPHFGDVEHPRLPGRLAGGSSSGSAALVAAGVVPLAIGTDTGGSIRVPAAYCGLFGLRLTPRHPWIEDAFPLAPSFDTPGWFTSTASDMRRAVAALLPPGTPMTRGIRGGFLDVGGVDEDVHRACENLRAGLGFERAGSSLNDSWSTTMREAGRAFSVVQSSEASLVHSAWLERRRTDYDPAVWARIDRGRRWTTAEREWARFAAESVERWWAAAFQEFDCLALPAVPAPTPRKCDASSELRDRILALTAPVSLAGLPVLSVPVSLAEGTTAGVQFVFPCVDSRRFDEILARVEEF